MFNNKLTKYKYIYYTQNIQGTIYNKSFFIKVACIIFQILQILLHRHNEIRRIWNEFEEYRVESIVKSVDCAITIFINASRKLPRLNLLDNVANARA